MVSYAPQGSSEAHLYCLPEIFVGIKLQLSTAVTSLSIFPLLAFFPSLLHFLTEAFWDHLPKKLT